MARQRQRGLVVMAGHTFIYSPAVRYVERLIDAGDLGDGRYVYSHRLGRSLSGRLKPFSIL